MNLEKIFIVCFIIILYVSCNNNEDLNEAPIQLENTIWKGSEIFKCHKNEGCVEFQILKFTSDNKFTFEYIDGQYGTYDDVITGTYIYNHPELILEIINDGTLKAFVREDGICLNEQNECSENSPELLLKQ